MLIMCNFHTNVLIIKYLCNFAAILIDVKKVIYLSHYMKQNCTVPQKMRSETAKTLKNSAGREIPKNRQDLRSRIRTGNV